MFSKIQPRIAMVTNMSYDEELIPEITAGIRAHYDGLFQFGAPVAHARRDLPRPLDH
jgi:ribonuclease Z